MPTPMHDADKTLSNVRLKQSQVMRLCSQIFANCIQDEDNAADATISAFDLVEKLQQQLMSESRDAQLLKSARLNSSGTNNRLRENVVECFKTLALFKLQLQPAIRRQHTLRPRRAGWKAGCRRRTSQASALVMRMRSVNQHRRGVSHPLVENPGMLGYDDRMVQSFPPIEEQTDHAPNNSTPAYHIVPVPSSPDRKDEVEDGENARSSDEEVHHYQSTVDVSRFMLPTRTLYRLRIHF